MDWLQFFGILVPLIAFFGFLYRELKDWRVETRAETRSIREETKSIREEINGVREEIRLQVTRSDRLYEMFIDLLKERRG